MQITQNVVNIFGIRLAGYRRSIAAEAAIFIDNVRIKWHNSSQQIDPETQLRVVIKQPWESLPIDIDFSRRIDIDETLLSVDEIDVSAIDGAEPVIVTKLAAGGVCAQGWFSGGEDGGNYKVNVRCTTSKGKRIERDGMIWVRD